MIVDVDVGGRRRRVVLSRTERGWHATIDGLPLHLDVAQVGQWWSLVIGPADAGPHDTGVAGAFRPPTPNASHEIAVDDRSRGDLVVHVDGVAVPVAVVDPRRSRFGSDCCKKIRDGCDSASADLR